MFVCLDEVDAEFAQRRGRRVAKCHCSVRRLHPRHLVALDVHMRVGCEIRDVGGHYTPIDMGAMTCLPQLACNKIEHCITMAVIHNAISLWLSCIHTNAQFRRAG